MKDCQNGNSEMDAAMSKPSARDLALAHRILDANLNRASEGLRVAEEYARFVLEDPFLSRRFKEARHALANSTKEIGGESARLAFRDVQQDVGTGISLPSQAARASLKEVTQAAVKRAEQALRSLEEHGKILSSEFARQCETLRYELYTLEKATLGRMDPSQTLGTAQIYVLIDGKRNLESFEAAVSEIVAAADIIQLRDKNLSDKDLLARARSLRKLTREAGCLFIVNDRPDIAALSDADGVHVGQDEIGVHDARRILGENALVGVSTHSMEQLRKAILDGASYIGCGPVFTSATKQFDRFPGTEYLRQAAKETSLPAFAIGGVNLANLDQTIEAGFHRVAVQSAIARPETSPVEVIHAMKSKLQSATP